MPKRFGERLKNRPSTHLLSILTRGIQRPMPFAVDIHRKSPLRLNSLNHRWPCSMLDTQFIPVSPNPYAAPSRSWRWFLT
jgi:hypothetical protein